MHAATLDAELNTLKVRQNSMLDEVKRLREEHAEDLIDFAYETLEGHEDLLRYHARHGTPSLLILTQCSPDIAVKSARLLSPLIRGKNVIEIGADVGFLAIELAKYAQSVIAIESDPAWSWVFTHSLYKHKPANLTWVFGNAESMIGKIKGDICLCFTRSGENELRALAKQFAPETFFPLGEESPSREAN